MTTVAGSPAGVESATTRRVLPWALANTALVSVFSTVTLGSPLFVLFLGRLGFSKTQVGLLLSLLPFCGLLSLVVAPWTERFGLKRTYILFYGVRKVIFASLILGPWVLNYGGARWAFVYVCLVVAAFAVCRALGEAGWYPWQQEFIADRVRGRFGAAIGIVGGVTGSAALWVSGLVLDRASGWTGYLLLIGASSAVGLVGMAFALPIPGGRPVRRHTVSDRPHWQDIRLSLGDRPFRTYLLAAGAMALAGVPLWSFLPLFLHEEVGFPDGLVAQLQAATLMGSWMTVLGWGWLGDHRGPRPVLRLSLGMLIAVSLGWALLPSVGAGRQGLALGLSVGLGMAMAGSMSGSSLLLYNHLVPRQRRVTYMAVWYAWTGVVGGVGPLAAGALIDLMHSGKGGSGIGAYGVLFVGAAVLTAGGLVLYQRAMRTIRTMGQRGDG